MTSSSPRKLTRSRDQRIVAGVCGGVANYLNMDPTLVRVVFVVLTVLTAGTVGLLAYLIGVLAIPEESLDPDRVDPHQIDPDQIAPDQATAGPTGFTPAQHPRPDPSANPDDLR